MIPQLGPLEIVVVVLVALLVFGPKRLPEVGRQVGRGLRTVKNLQEQVSQELHQVLHSDDPEDPFSGLTDFVSRVGGSEAKNPEALHDETLHDGTLIDEGPPDQQPLSETVSRTDLRGDAEDDDKNPRPSSGTPGVGQAPSKYRPPVAE
ncbi:mttA/Hcf106 family protein [Actinobacteria bacterium IMCC26256]|jgi:TatA/E family protein of Tat protein translocase|nr:mttA/Hcf106 family protein [Actinobacteria bacterium IMCC26256]